MLANSLSLFDLKKEKIYLTNKFEAFIKYVTEFKPFFQLILTYWKIYNNKIKLQY